MAKNDTIKIPSIGSIILWFFLFFPVSFYLIYLRMIRKYGKHIALTKFLYNSGLFWFLLGVFYLFYWIFEEDYLKNYLPQTLILFIIPGLILFFFGYNRKKKDETLYLLIEYLNERKRISIHELCSDLNMSVLDAKLMLSKMINSNMIDALLQEDELIMAQYYNEEE